MPFSHLYTDQIGRKVSVPNNPQRIVSLVPSQTELLFDLGLDDEIVGLTKFCTHPRDRVKSKTNIGGTKKFRFEKIDQLKPDLILGNKEENYREGIERLKQHYPVWVSDVKNFEGALSMIANIGRIVGRLQNALEMIKSIQNDFESLSTPESPKRVLYFIWQNPNMVVGGDTFIDDLLGKAGYINLTKYLTRYPELSDEEVRELNPDLIFLSSEPYPFQDKHLVEFQQKFPSAQIQLVDGEMFSWYGSRLKLVPAYFRGLNL